MNSFIQTNHTDWKRLCTCTYIPPTYFWVKRVTSILRSVVGETGASNQISNHLEPGGQRSIIAHRQHSYIPWISVPPHSVACPQISWSRWSKISKNLYLVSYMHSVISLCQMPQQQQNSFGSAKTSCRI